LDEKISFNGAILHDIGKAHPFFQERLKGKTNSRNIFRHEIASLFFLSLFPKEQWDILIEMVAAHHKSVVKDIGLKGLLDLEENDEYEDFHLGKWEEWSPKANDIIQQFGFRITPINRDEAIKNLKYCIEYCEKTVQQKKYSEWRGVLMGADHFASSLCYKTSSEVKRLFKIPKLSFYNRINELYPLSLKDASSSKEHTIVVASTGAGKTDFLFRRCRGRVFYTLPFQASINAMYNRAAKDLEKDNPDLDIRILHSTSIIVKRKETEETALQNLMGSSIKILTPHQLASIVLGMKCYEAMILDLRGCDIILDEVHTYSGISQALVLKLIEVLKFLNCKIHIGTATMPSVLYQEIKKILGEDVLEVHLTEQEMQNFNRHIIHKIEAFESTQDILPEQVYKGKKILIVMNTIREAQSIFETIKEQYHDVPLLLLHSKFKRSDRNIKEKQLLGIDEVGETTFEFNTSTEACIVVSTQIVEVSLDISFDIMITATAPLDAMIQRFGRVNRKRNKDTIGKFKDIYVIAPPESDKDARPYDLEILKKSFEVLPDNEILQEKDLQNKIDQVYTSIDVLKIDEHSIFKPEVGFTLGMLTHRSKAILFELLQIESVSCILESDVDTYNEGDFETRLNLEIPVSYWSVAKMEQTVKGNKPFIIPDKAYDFEMGLSVDEIKQENFNVLNQFL
ncbi:MAG: CRISPR-associated helicase Cas3', partial [Bacteroidetes bacterium]|nr:CRISPR-associated helicase Cas3' [Bacteroidota bacterium]